MNNDKTSKDNTGSNENGIGPIVGTLIIVILLVATALYIWSEHLNTTTQIEKEVQNLGTTTTTIIYSTSTVSTDIQNDLKSNQIIKNPGF